MGRFLNPNNSAFQKALNSEIYVDKTGMLAYTNKVIDSKQAFICNSRPRRFGKSTTADMLAAYYSKGCDSKDMFSELSIAKDDSFPQYLNQYDVIHFDVQWFLNAKQEMTGAVRSIQKAILQELQEAYPELQLPEDMELPEALSRIYEETGSKFVVIIDEWDVLIRDRADNDIIQKEYIDFLQRMFKGIEPTKYIALAYMTGILPIKKYKTQSALNNFDEYTMLSSGVLAPYIGFTENEVKELCVKYQKDFQMVKHWYDGYQLGNDHIYNPRAVVRYMQQGELQSYWSQTGTYESVLPLINMDYDGLKTSIIEMVSGNSVEVDVGMFQNDVVHFADKEDVLTYLIHLGYLGYDAATGTAFIPNEEIRLEFRKALKRKKWSELQKLEMDSFELLDATLNLDERMVAEQIDGIHTQYISSVQYNDENSLSCVLTIGYISTMQYYFKPVRECPAGRGFADLLYLPKMEYASEYPALLLELKWNKNAETALTQIKEKRYTDALREYHGDILLVGINYDKKTKKHECKIEKAEVKSLFPL